ncbi:hypothetical protein VP1G_11353 [Cytospora mali]|uniref:Uncharacterized protein n=1 Tax=Cytospora mali TaxID=578113 RepID=A0A194VDV1_CYTMA|nr:hypothetical protein VP1G_11353 [Valsa mali var. pyri (nom. inval.)]
MVQGLSFGLVKLSVLFFYRRIFSTPAFKGLNTALMNADGISHLTTMMFWSMIEMGIAIIAGCLSTIWPLISKVSLGNMSLRESSAKGSKNRSGAGAYKLDHSNKDGGSYILSPGSMHESTTVYCKSQSQERFDRSVEIKRLPAEGTLHSESLHMQDLGVRRVTQVSASGNMKHGDSYV